MFPLEPIGQCAVINVIDDGMTAGGLLMPNESSGDEYVVGEVIAVGSGTRSMVSGEVIPNDIAVGDTVIYQKAAAHGISYSVRKHLINRGIPEQSLDKMCIVMNDNIVAKLREVPTGNAIKLTISQAA